MGDYPDYTRLFNLIGTNIMIPVDIQAQYVDLDINIKSQKVTINIDIDAQSVGVYLQADWATKEGDSKVLQDIATNVARGSGKSVSHTVPAGKTLYINYLSCYNVAYASADGDKDQMCLGLLSINFVVKVYIGGNGGAAISFATPLRVDAGERLDATVQNWANHNTNLGISVMGYEV